MIGHYCVMLAVGPKEDLLKHCARQAFYERPKSGLLFVTKEVGYEVDVAAGLPQILLQLCSQIHPKMSDEDKLNPSGRGCLEWGTLSSCSWKVRGQTVA